MTLKSRWLRVLTFFNQMIWKSKRIVSKLNNIPFPILKKYEQMNRKLSKYVPRRKVEIKNYETVLLSYSEKNENEIWPNRKFINCNTINVGYPRAYKNWENYIEQSKKKLFESTKIIGPI